MFKTKPTIPDQIYQTKQNLSNQIKPTKPSLPNQTYKTKHTKPNIPNQPYKTESKNQTYQTKCTKPTKLNQTKYQNYIHKLIWQIETMLVNQRKHRSSVSQTNLSFPELGTAQPQLVSTSFFFHHGNTT